MNFHGEMPDPNTNRMQPYRVVLTVENNDRHVVEMYMRDKRGQEFKHGEIVYER